MDSITIEQWQQSGNRKIKAYDETLISLQPKGNILGMHSPTFTYDIKENVELKINLTEKEDQEYDFTLLTFEEQMELYYIV
ncbi:MAG: hypothetical protein ACXWCG_08615 [Flavitalea sp.]